MQYNIFISNKKYLSKCANCKLEQIAKDSIKRKVGLSCVQNQIYYFWIFWYNNAVIQPLCECNKELCIYHWRETQSNKDTLDILVLNDYFIVKGQTWITKGRNTDILLSKTTCLFSLRKLTNIARLQYRTRESRFLISEWKSLSMTFTSQKWRLKENITSRILIASRTSTSWFIILEKI